MKRLLAMIAIFYVAGFAWFAGRLPPSVGKPLAGFHSDIDSISRTDVKTLAGQVGTTMDSLARTPSQLSGPLGLNALKIGR